MSIDYQTICRALYQEARFLDDRQWDEWLACYTEDVTYWMPAWDDDDTLTDDPHSQISLMYYADRGGLEDRVFRIKTERSGASMPEPRTCHNVTNVEVLGERNSQNSSQNSSENGGEVDVRYNFNTLSHRYRVTDQFFGTIYVTFRKVDDRLLITSKKIALKNDYIRQVLDVYHV